ncbi:MAG: ABC transporter ATP-binding protein [Neobacillus sp.]
MEKMIQTEHLTKTYKGFNAVDHVSLSVNKGEIYGFIGLNGAGKTTTIRMLLGMIRPTQGSCYINGQKVSLRNHDIWNDVGYMVETPYAYPELTVKENLEIFRRLRMLPDPHSVNRVIDQLKLTPYTDKKAKHLSLGNAQRLGIAKALLHQPKILILDEPVNGLDPAGIVEIRELLQDLALNKGITLFISSHLLSEVAKVATKIGIIHQGRLIQEVDSSRLAQLLQHRLLVDAREKSSALTTLNAAGYSFVINEDGWIETYQESAVQHPDQIAHFLVHQGFPPTKLLVEEENLESYFLRVIGTKGVGV